MIPRGNEEGNLPPGRSKCDMLVPLRSTLFQWFFIALSVRPVRYLAISDHLLPKCLCNSSSLRSSASVQGSFFTLSSKWLYHRSRHCFPVLPFSWAATVGQARVPSRATNLRTIASSAFDHGRLCTRFFSIVLRLSRRMVKTNESSRLRSSSEQLDPEPKSQKSSEQKPSEPIEIGIFQRLEGGGGLLSASKMDRRGETTTGLTAREE